MEFILMPTTWGDCQVFIIPKKQFKVDYKKRYRLKLEEVIE